MIFNLNFQHPHSSLHWKITSNIYTGYVVLGVLSVHWLSCLVYAALARTHFYGGLVWNEWFFKLISSITMVLVFFNIV